MLYQTNNEYALYPYKVTMNGEEHYTDSPDWYTTFAKVHGGECVVEEAMYTQEQLNRLSDIQGLKYSPDFDDYVINGIIPQTGEFALKFLQIQNQQLTQKVAELEQIVSGN